MSCINKHIPLSSVHFSVMFYFPLIIKAFCICFESMSSVCVCVCMCGWMEESVCVTLYIFASHIYSPKRAHARAHTHTWEHINAHLGTHCTLKPVRLYFLPSVPTFVSRSPSAAFFSAVSLPPLLSGSASHHTGNTATLTTANKRRRWWLTD